MVRGLNYCNIGVLVVQNVFKDTELSLQGSLRERGLYRIQFFEGELGTDCGFFDWFDPPMCARSTQIIPGLLRSRNLLEESRNVLQESMNVLQESMNSMQAANRRLKIWLVSSWVVFLVYIMY
ncbi:hypothetical protein Tco_0967659 [Tanacetum coccineum]